MQNYFAIQHRRLRRWLTDLGINPYVGYVLAFLAFFLSSKLLFFKTTYASWIYLFVATSAIYNIGNRKRNNRLKSIFSSKDYPLIRISENCLAILPFWVYLLYELQFLQALIVLILAVLLAFVTSPKIWHKVIPTPFRRYPFEFIVGFRKTFWMVAIAHFLVFKAIQVDNYNLGLFALVLIFFIAMFYYHKPEPGYFVWMHTNNTDGFLKEKFLSSVVCMSILSVLAFLVMLIAFSVMWLTTCLVYLAAFVLPGSMLVAKYSSYPHENNIPQAILYAISFMFPPMLLFTIWIFYKQSKRRLDPILEC